MITPEKIDEWINEVKDRPGSAVIILQYISNRLRDLTQRNEDLRADNLALRTEKKVEEYERRIANLEYQLDLLKRQFGGDPAVLEALASAATPVGVTPDLLSVLVFDARGHILRLEARPRRINRGRRAGSARQNARAGGRAAAPAGQLRIRRAAVCIFVRPGEHAGCRQHPDRDHGWQAGLGAGQPAG